MTEQEGAAVAVAKMRGIKPDFWTDSKVASVSIPARLLFIGMWTYACDNGHLDNDAMQLKMRVFPADAVSVGEVEDMVDELVTIGLVERADGWLKVVRLSDHQKVDLRYLILCDQCEHDVHSKWTRRDRVERTRGAQRVPGGHPPRTQRAPDDEGEGEGEGEGEDKHSPITAPSNDVASPPEPEPKPARASAGEHPKFEEFWKVYPRRQAKADAVKAWKAATKKARPEVITDAARRHATTTWSGKETKFIPLAATWLRAERWNDPIEEPDWAQTQRMQAARGVPEAMRVGRPDPRGIAIDGSHIPEAMR